MVTVNIEIEEPTLLLSILTDALEGGMASWSQTEEYKWRWWYAKNDDGSINTSVINPDLTGDRILLRVRDVIEDEDFVDISLDRLHAAAVWALFSEYSHNYSFTIKDGHIEDIDYDAVGADIILQKIVLNEVVYG
jgi:hypothetical protein